MGTAGRLIGLVVEKLNAAARKRWLAGNRAAAYEPTASTIAMIRSSGPIHLKWPTSRHHACLPAEVGPARVEIQTYADIQSPTRNMMKSPM
jgi:hypothetical protein